MDPRYWDAMEHSFVAFFIPFVIHSFNLFIYGKSIPTMTKNVCILVSWHIGRFDFLAKSIFLRIVSIWVFATPFSISYARLKASTTSSSNSVSAFFTNVTMPSSMFFPSMQTSLL